MAARPRVLIAGNWKMNGLRADGLQLARDIAAGAVSGDGGGQGGSGCDLLVCPPATLVAAVAEVLGNSEVLDGGIAVGGQDCDADPSGARTGDVSAEMLADLGCRYVIVGHSERRAGHGEADAQVRAKAEAAHRAALTPIICVGETAEQRDAGQTLEVVGRQLAGSLPPAAAAANTVIAYEPVWAIGTGRTATPAEVGEIHAAIRDQLRGQAQDSEALRILYGGSVKPENAAELLAVDNVDGALVGGASLKAADFLAIARAV